MSKLTTLQTAWLPRQLRGLRGFAFLAVGIFGALTVTLTAFTGTANAVGGCVGMCVWKDANYSGTKVEYLSLAYNTCYNIQVAMNDEISSIDNHIVGLYMYSNANCSGNRLRVDYLEHWSNLAWTGMNDTISSFKTDAL